MITRDPEGIQSKKTMDDNLPADKYDPLGHPSQAQLYDFEEGAMFDGKTMEEIELRERAERARMILRQSNAEDTRPKTYEQYMTILEEIENLIQTIEDAEEKSLNLNTKSD